MRQGHPPAEAAKISLERIIQNYPKFEGAVGKQNKKLFTNSIIIF